MAATVITKEPFEKSISRQKLEKERKLRIQAGAIKSWIEDETNRWIIVTEWNVIGGE